MRSRTFGLGQTNLANKFCGTWSIFRPALILVLWVSCSWFPLINHYFYKKLSLFIDIPNIYLGLGFEFGLQRISLCVSIVRELNYRKLLYINKLLILTLWMKICSILLHTQGQFWLSVRFLLSKMKLVENIMRCLREQFLRYSRDNSFEIFLKLYK